MKYWLDTEFIARPFTIDLISIGLVADNGREFYAESSEVDWSKASPWTLENVRPQLDGKGTSARICLRTWAERTSPRRSAPYLAKSARARQPDPKPPRAAARACRQPAPNADRRRRHEDSRQRQQGVVQDGRKIAQDRSRGWPERLAALKQELTDDPGASSRRRQAARERAARDVQARAGRARAALERLEAERKARAKTHSKDEARKKEPRASTSEP